MFFEKHLQTPDEREIETIAKKEIKNESVFPPKFIVKKGF